MLHLRTQSGTWVISYDRIIPPMIPSDSFLTDAVISTTDTVAKEHTQKIRLTSHAGHLQEEMT
jgi:hypothetical protein